MRRLLSERIFRLAFLFHYKTALSRAEMACVVVDSSGKIPPNLLRGRSTWGEAPLEKSGSDRAECKIQVCCLN